MRHHHPIRRQPRRGICVVECAVLYPLVLLIFVGMLVVGMGVYRNDHVAGLASEGARWASVRGWQYENDLNPLKLAGLPHAATEQDVRDYIVSRAVNLDTRPEILGVQVRWDSSNKKSHALMDDAGNPRVDADGSVIEVSNTVTVTVTYRWAPEVLFAGPIVLKSTSTVPMSY